MIQTYSGLDSLPANLRVYGASDYATMEPEPGKKEPDFTEHGVVGMDRTGDLWMLDWWFDQVETDKSIRAFIQLVDRWKPIRWWNEGGIIDKAIKPAIRRGMKEGLNGRPVWTSLEALPSIQDKGLKLVSFHARSTGGTVHFPIRRKWTDHVIDQLVKFPGGRWDDAADVCGLMGRGIDKMYEPGLSVEHHRPQLVPFTNAWLEYTADTTPKVRYF